LATMFHYISLSQNIFSITLLHFQNIDSLFSLFH
jgi:hypothetical protein